MKCLEPEVLSRWLDGLLPRGESAAVEHHVTLCRGCGEKVRELRQAADWITRSMEPGRSCLSAEEMAVLLEGGQVPPHVRTCPRCAGELAGLRPRKRSTRRITTRPESTGTGWFIAAAAVMMAVVGLVFLAQQKSVPDVARAPLPPSESFPEPVPLRPQAPSRTEPLPLRPVPPLEGRDPEPFVVPPPKPIEPVPASPEPRVEAPQPPTPKAPEPSPNPRPTIVQAPAKRDVACSIRAGALSTLAGGKWTGVARIEEGMPLRAEGKTSVDLGRARVTLEGSSHFTLAKDEVTLTDGTLSLEAQQGSTVSLILGGCRIQPMASAGRVLLSARPDRVIIDEGAARWQEIVLHQGVEHQVVREKLEPQKRRTLPAAARPREVPMWKPDFKDAAIRSRIRGRIDTLPEGIQVVSVAADDRTYFQSQAGFQAPDERGLFALRPVTALRFRYYLSEPALLQLVVYNGSKRENFNLDLDPVTGRWTTATVYFRDIPVNQGGDHRLKFETGDRIWSVGWFVGKPGSGAAFTVDSLEVIEVER